MDLLGHNTMEIWQQVLSGLSRGQVANLVIGGANPMDGEQVFYNLKPETVEITRRVISPTMVYDEGYIAPTSPVTGLLIKGVDMDNPELGQISVFMAPTAVLVHAPAKSTEPDLFEALETLFFGTQVKSAEQPTHFEFPVPVLPTIPVNPDLKSMYHQLQVARVDSALYISPETPVVNIHFADTAYFDMLVTAVWHTKDGIIIGFKDLDDKALNVQLLAGRTVAAPDSTYYVLFRDLRAVDVCSAQTNAARVLQHGRNDSYAEPTVLDVPAVIKIPAIPAAPMLDELLKRQLQAAVWHSDRIGPDTPVVRLEVNGSLLFRGVILTSVAEIPGQGLTVTFRQFCDFERNKTARVQVLAGIEIPLPPVEHALLIANLQMVTVQSARVYAAKVLLDATNNPLEVAFDEPPAITRISAKEVEPYVTANANMLSPNSHVITLTVNGESLGNWVVVRTTLDGGGLLLDYHDMDALAKEDLIRLVCGQQISLPPMKRTFVHEAKVNATTALEYAINKLSQ